MLLILCELFSSADRLSDKNTLGMTSAHFPRLALNVVFLFSFRDWIDKNGVIQGKPRLRIGFAGDLIFQAVFSSNTSHTAVCFIRHQIEFGLLSL